MIDLVCSRRGLAMFATLAGLILSFSPEPARAQSQATGAFVYVVHGLPGRELGATVNPALPVDVLIDGSNCVIHGASFGEIAGPFNLPAGSHSFVVSSANTTTPCGNAALITATASLIDGQVVSLIAGLNTANTPSLIAASHDLSSVADGKARVIAVNAANAQGLDLFISEHTRLSNIQPGSSASATVSATDVALAALQTGTDTVLAGFEGVRLRNRSVNLVYIVGTQANSSLAILVKQVREVL